MRLNPHTRRRLSQLQPEQASIASCAPSPAGPPAACSSTAILKPCDSSTTARTLCTTPTNPTVFVFVSRLPACPVRDFLPLAVACRHCQFTLHALPCACPLAPTRLPTRSHAPSPPTHRTSPIP
ncbi:hypothetical protein HBI57_089600 [Parastagonospora nodorum]|nr:hypothetical protein HBI57_089600 [Parastagonospora nodorum]KAH6477970.1 hypothetical protein HBI58_100980 [Parastagonospora nodorum]